MKAAEPTLKEQIACVAREVAFRQNVYPRWIEQKRMTREQAELEMVRMQAVMHTLLDLLPRETAHVTDA